jgi:hypothetical protein
MMTAQTAKNVRSLENPSELLKKQWQEAKGKWKLLKN